MLLNPTHEITLSGLPPDVLDAYVRYKKGTRAIVAWVIQYAPSRYAGKRSLPIKELAKLAATLAGRVKQLPDVIHFHFRETIAARKRLSKYFRGFRDEEVEDLGTVNHEHFTSSLTKIYADLCKICELPKIKCKGIHPEMGYTSPTRQTVNVYEGLEVEDDDTDEHVEVIEPPEDCAECQIDNVRACPGPPRDIRLADDDLGNAIEYASALQEVQQVVEEVEQCWSRAAQEEVHFVSAAYLTHVGYANLLQIERRLRELDEDVSFAGLQQTCCVLLNQSSTGGETSAWHEMLKQLSAHQQTVEHYAGEHKSSKSAVSSALVQKPHEYISEDESGTNLLVPTLLQNAIELVYSSCTPSAIVRNSTPIYADLGYLMLHPAENGSKFRLSLSIHLLARSYSSYILALRQPARAFGGRLAALRLAQSAATSVSGLLEDKNCFPCRCIQTLAFHLQNLEADLRAFAQHKKWDLLFQSPYVAGSHIVEILDLCHYYGSKLFVYRHYIGALVHSYNVMNQLAGLEKIPLMEYLCEEFRHTFFPAGQRPTRSFRACWTRYIGARIKFKKGHRRNKNDSWCMAIPPHEAKKAAGLGVGRNEGSNEKGECLIFRIKQRDYDVTDAQLEQIDVDFKRGYYPPCVQTDLSATAPAHRLSSILPLLEKDLACIASTASDPHLPKARMNHFKVFRDCVRIVAEISDSTHTAPKEKGMNCICFASAILEGGDRILEARAVGRASGKGACWTKDEREGVLETTARALREVLGGRAMTATDGWGWEF